MEATVVCVDNSEFTRNGDYYPNRFQAQADAVNLLAGAKTGANPENTVGVLACATVAGKAPKVLVTPTPDLGKVLTAMSAVTIEGAVDLCKSAQIAQLALKHRQNKNQRQRIVLFIGSPISDEQDALVKVGKKLKKNNVSVDVVAFGDCAESNKARLEAFVGAVCKDDNSHYVEAPIGSNLCDEILSSPVMVQAGGYGGGEGASAAGGGGGGGGGGYEFGVDPNVDPELALALRVSMEEERARQAAAAQAAAAAAANGADADEQLTAAVDAATAAAAAAGSGGSGAAPAQPAATPPTGQPAGDSEMMEDEDALLQQALAMSMQEAGPQSNATPAAAHEDTAMAETDDPDLAAALAMSMVDAEPSSAPAPDADSAALAQMMADSLGALPGVDTNDQAVKDAIEAATKELNDKNDNEKKEDK